MTGPIHSDTFDQLCEAERRLKFLAAFVAKYGCIIRHNGCAHLGFPVGRDTEALPGLIDRLMVRYPELTEERTEVALCHQKD